MKKVFAKIRFKQGVTWTLHADDYGHVIHCVNKTLEGIDLNVNPIKRIEIHTDSYNADGLIDERFVEYFYEW